MKSEDLGRWICEVETERENLRPAKRRRLGRKRPSSDTEVDYAARKPSLQTEPSTAVPINDLEAMPRPQKRLNSTGLPPSRSSKSTRLSETTIDDLASSSVATSSVPASTTANVLASNYRERVLHLNGVQIEEPFKDFPDRIRAAVDQFEKSPTTFAAAAAAAWLGASSEMTLVQAKTWIVSFEKARSEAEFCRLLTKAEVFPDGDKSQGLHCVEGQLLMNNALPRSIDESVSRITASKPDFAYGYSSSCLGSSRELVAQPWCYQPYNDLYWPFLTIEVKSQATVKNVFQATNQCAGGGIIGSSAITTLLENASAVAADAEAETTSLPGQGILKVSDQGPAGSGGSGRLPPYQTPNSPSLTSPSGGSLTSITTSCQWSPSSSPSPSPSPQPPPLNPREAIVFSLAIDSAIAYLYVHWQGTPLEYQGPPISSSSSFHMQRIEVYPMVWPEQLIQLQSKLREIVAWGMGPRLAMVKRALDILKN